MQARLLTMGLLGALSLAPVMAATISFPNSVCASAASGVGAFIGCVDDGFVNQAHGDVAGQLDVSYRDVDSIGGDSLRWWGAGYNDLPSALWARGHDGDSFGRITLTPGAGMSVTLDGLDLGSYVAINRSTNLRIFALGGGSLIYSGPVGPGPGPSHFAPGLSSSTGIVIEWENSAYNVGINNISYTLSPVPEPSSYALMLAGLSAIGLIARRRRAR